jgi:hypothetical protein
MLGGVGIALRLNKDVQHNATLIDCAHRRADWVMRYCSIFCAIPHSDRTCTKPTFGTRAASFRARISLSAD